MSLIQCAECSEKMSDKADKCPHCGAPNVKLINEITLQRRGNTGEKFQFFSGICVLLGGPLFIYIVYKNFEINRMCGDYGDIFFNNLLVSILMIPLQAFEYGTTALTSCYSSNMVFLNRLFLAIVVLNQAIKLANHERLEHHKEADNRKKKP